MSKRIQATLNDEQYTLVKGKWLDSCFIEVPISIAIQLTDQILNSNIDDLSNEELEKYVMGFKEQGLIPQALQVADALYARYLKAQDLFRIRWLMPIETSLLRLSHTPQKAIDYYTAQIAKFGSEVNSPQVMTSVAAAYCDVRDYAKAKQLCDAAFAWGGYSYELASVYGRIKAEA